MAKKAASLPSLATLMAEELQNALKIGRLKVRQVVFAALGIDEHFGDIRFNDGSPVLTAIRRTPAYKESIDQCVAIITDDITTKRILSSKEVAQFKKDIRREVMDEVYDKLREDFKDSLVDNVYEALKLDPSLQPYLVAADMMERLKVGAK